MDHNVPHAQSIATSSFPSGISLEHEIKRLKKEMNAIILAHYYQYAGKKAKL